MVHFKRIEHFIVLLSNVSFKLSDDYIKVNGDQVWNYKLFAVIANTDFFFIVYA